ncbi:MAG: prepilin-type N-terminal cleavage/methylation domain-containing protein [Candidatus Omnitrophica bacterium]|nr:prepilin-type N-terminal cleavage/methylation domain-containing protein [Candidatus Omnitrophota bacterium]
MSSAVLTSPKRLEAGFTLIELVLVASILLVLAGLSVPRFQRTFLSLSVKDSAFNLAKLITLARQEAVWERKNFKISFNVVKGQYQLWEIDESSVPLSYKKVAGRMGKLFALPRGVFLKSSRNETVFYPDGHCDSVRVDMTDKEGLGRRLDIQSPSCRSSVKDLVP